MEKWGDETVPPTVNEGFLPFPKPCPELVEGGGQEGFQPITSATPTNLAAAFRHIAATRMAGVALVNPALSVEAVGFRPWNDDSVGVLITPWCMNLICLPGAASAWTAWGSGSRHHLALPGGDYEFLTAEEDAIGPYLSASLFSPLFEFADMDQAREVALAVLKEVFKPAAAPTPPPAGLQQRLDQPLSRRGFLGAFLGRSEHP